MSEQFEHEKLTPDSRKGYDGSDTHMAEEHHESEDQQSYRYESEASKRRDNDETEEAKDQAAKELREARIANAKFAESFTNLFFTVVLSQDKEDVELGRKMFEVLTTPDEDKGISSEEKLVSLLAKFPYEEETSKVDVDKEQDRIAENTKVAYVAGRLQQYALETGLDPMALFGLEPPPETAQEEEQSKKIEAIVEHFVAETLDHASQPALQAMRQRYEQLRKTTKDSKLEEQIKRVDELLEKLAELKKEAPVSTKATTGEKAVQEAPAAKEEHEVFAAEKFNLADSIENLYASERFSDLQEQSELTAAIVGLAIGPKEMDGPDGDKKVAELMSCFPTDETNTPEQRRAAERIRQQILALAVIHGNDKQSILMELATIESGEQLTHETEIFLGKHAGQPPERPKKQKSGADKLESLIKQHLDSVKAEDFASISKHWTTLTKTIGNRDEGEVGIEVGRIINEVAANRGIKDLEAFLAGENAQSAEEREEVERMRVRKEQQAAAVTEKLQQIEEGLRGVDIPELQDYLHGLMKRLKSKAGDLTPKDLQAELDGLSNKAVSIIRTIKGEAALKDEHTRKKIEEQINAINRAIHPVRSFMTTLASGVLPSTAKKEETREKGDDQQEKKQAFMEKVKGVIELEDYDKLSEAQLQEYVEGLSDVLSSQEGFSEEELKSAYIALDKQWALLRRKADRTGGNASDITRLVNPAMLRLHKQLIECMTPEEYRKFVKHVGDTLLEDEKYRSAIAFTPELAAGNIPVKTPQGEITGEPALTLQDDTYASAVKSNIASLREPPSPGDPGYPTDPDEAEFVDEERKLVKRAKKAVPRFVDAAKDRPGNIVQIELMQGELNEMLVDALKKGTDLGPVQSFAAQLYNQRIELQKLQHYQGDQDDRPYPPEDKVLYQGNIDTALQERILRIRKELAVRNSANTWNRDYFYENEQILDYYKELQRWAKIILENDIRNNPDKVGDPEVLRLSAEKYESFKKVAYRDMNNIKNINSRVGTQMLTDLDMLEKNKYLRYFQQSAPDPSDPGQMMGTDYIHPTIGRSEQGYGVPESLEDTMRMIAKQFTDGDYGIGGEHELIDKNGNFRVENFYFWVRERTTFEIGQSPDGQASPLSSVSLKGNLSQTSLQEILLIPQFLSRKRFEIKMRGGDENEIAGAWGKSTFDKNFSQERAHNLLFEVYRRQRAHNAKIEYLPGRRDRDKFLQALRGFHDDNHLGRSNNILEVYGLPSTTGGRGMEEINRFNDQHTQESLGLAINDIGLAIYYLSEFTQYYKKDQIDPVTGKPVIDPKTHEPKQVDKTFNENMFYKFWEPNGANAFLIGLMEGTLNTNENAKHVYRKFISDRLQAAAQDYIALHPSKRGEIEVALNKQLEETTKNGTISFTESKQLADFHKIVRRDTLHERVDRDGMAKVRIDVKKDLLDHIKDGFINEVKNIQVVEVAADVNPDLRKDEHWDGFLKTTGKTVRLGDIQLSDGTKLDVLFGAFDADQVRAFDYTKGDDNDPVRKAEISRGRPFKNTPSDQREIRAILENFMDEKSRNHELFKKNEKLAIALAEKVGRRDRKELNFYRRGREHQNAREMIRSAMEKSIRITYGIDEVEGKYAREWGEDYGYLFGTAEHNDTESIGFGQYAKLLRFAEWRARRATRDSAGNPVTLEEFGALTRTFPEMMPMRKKGEAEAEHTVFSLGQGGRGGYIAPRYVRSYGSRDEYEAININAQRELVDNNITNGLDFVNLVVSKEMDASKIVSIDRSGKPVWHQEEAFKFFKAWRTAIRYTFGQNDLDYTQKIWVDGHETPLLHHYFGPKTRGLLKLIIEENHRPLRKAYEDAADAVMTTQLGAEIHAHREMFGNHHHWTIQDVVQMKQFYQKHMRDLDLKYVKTEEGGHTVWVRRQGHGHEVINDEIYAAMLKAYHSSWLRMYATETWSGFWSGLFGGIWEGLEEYIKTSNLKI